MGGALQASDDRQPTFLTWAVADPNTAQLQRVQIIKGWLEDGEHQEQVYDVACSDGLSVDPSDPSLSRITAHALTWMIALSRPMLDRVNSKPCGKTPTSLPGQEAFYYVRVFENPVCRWSTWDAIRADEAPRSDLSATIQERAWSSPIWYSAAATTTTL